MTGHEAALTVLRDGTRGDVAAFLAALTPSERTALGPRFRRWAGSTSEPCPVGAERAALAVLATADGLRQARVFDACLWRMSAEFIADAVRILRLRSPAWLPDFTAAILNSDNSRNWRLGRAIIRAGLAPEPDVPGYRRGTVFGISGNCACRHPLLKHLEADPDLIPGHLLATLSTEGTGRLLATHDRDQARDPEDATAGGTWRAALAALAGDGRIGRDRLIETVLAALLSDWAAADLGWYVGMHDALSPSLDEVAGRQATYVRLLAAWHGPSVQMAQRQLLRLIPDERFEPEPFLAASRATLGRSNKATVAVQLRLLGTLAAARPGVSIARTVQVAGDHPRADIRELASTILRQCGAAAVQAPVSVPPLPQPRCAAAAVRPAESASELAEVLLGLLEEVDALQLERAIDGLLRFSAERPPAAGVLLDRAAAAAYDSDDPRTAARVLSLAWLSPRAPQPDGDWPIVLGRSEYPTEAAAPQTFVGAIGRRLTAVARAVRAGPHPSLALPTSTDFSLDAGELSRRLADTRQPARILELELAVALLRVPACERAAVAVPAPARTSAAVARVRAGQPPRWRRDGVAVFRDELGSEDDAAAGLLSRADPERTADAEAFYGASSPRFERTMALGAALLPHDHDVLAAHAHPYLYRDLVNDRASCVPVIDAIARARSATGPPSSSALVLALAARDARGRIAAQDAILDLTRHGYLDGSQLGRQAALLLPGDILVGQRVSSGLAECARASDAAVLPVLSALQEIAPVLPGRRDASAFLDLAAEFARRAGRTFTLPPGLRELAAGPSSSVLAQSARRLLRQSGA